MYVVNSPDSAVSDDGRRLFVILTTDHLLQQQSKLTRNVSADGTYKVGPYYIIASVFPTCLEVITCPLFHWPTGPAHRAPNDTSRLV
jgi:hypothetical protein